MRDYEVRSFTERFRDGGDVSREILTEHSAKFSQRLREEYKWVLPADEAAHIVNLAIARGCRRCASFDPAKGKLEAWLWQIVKREASTTIRSDAHRQRCREKGVDHDQLAHLAVASAAGLEDGDDADI